MKAVTSSGKLSPLFVAYPLPILLFGRDDLRVLDANQAAVRLYGWSRDELLGMTLLDMASAPDEGTLRTDVAAHPGTTTIWQQRASDGRILRLEATISDLEVAGRPVRLALMRDVSEAERADAARRVLAQAGAALARSLDPEATLRDVASLAVPELADYCLVHLLSPDDVLRQVVFAHRDPEKQRRLGESTPLMDRKLSSPISVLARVARTGRAELVEHAREDGMLSGEGGKAVARITRTLAPTCFVVAPLVGRERSVGVLMLAQAESGRRFGAADLSLATEIGHLAGMALENAQLYRAAQDELAQRLALEERLVQAEKMEAIGRLAGGVAHDFNNILTGVKGHCAFLLDALAQGDPRRAEAEEIDRATDRASALTRQLLAFGRRQVLQPRELGVNAVVTDMEAMLRRVIGEDIELVTRLDRQAGSVRADPGQLQQVILNLVVNARDAMPDGGRIVISTGRTELDGTGEEGLAAGRYAMLEVEDTGHGIDPSVLPHIFEPFFTTRGLGEGTGLGLATVYGIITQSSGTIAVTSKPGSTGFRILLPEVAAGEPLRVQQQATPRSDRGTETILLVEDEAPVRDVARRTLVAGGYRVLTAASGDEALRMAQDADGPIHLLLTDVVLPGMRGTAVAHRLVSLLPGLRVLFVSGYAEDLVLGRDEPVPGAAFLEKPFAPLALRRKVRETLDA